MIGHGGLSPSRQRLRRRGMYLLPSLFTVGNIGAGYFAIENGPGMVFSHTTEADDTETNIFHEQERGLRGRYISGDPHKTENPGRCEALKGSVVISRLGIHGLKFTKARPPEATARFPPVLPFASSRLEGSAPSLSGTDSFTNNRAPARTSAVTNRAYPFIHS